MPRRALAVLALVAAIGAGITVWQLQGEAVAKESLPVVKATRGDLVLSVGGVGRIVEAAAPAQTTGAQPAGSGAASGSGGSAPAGAVFPRSAGQIARLLVSPGQRVVAGQPLARLDDNGSAAAAVEQARNELATARLELAQKQTSDPNKGLPATPAELQAAELAVTAAAEKLALLHRPPSAVDVTAAQSELSKAEADLEALQRPPGPAALASARLALGLARARFAQLTKPPAAVDVLSAKVDLKKAEADLETLQLAPVLPSATAIEAAQLAVELASQKLAALTTPPKPDPRELAEAEQELRNAEGDLANLEARPSPPTETELAEAQLAVDAARYRLEQLTKPSGTPAEVAAARLELKKAQADLEAIQRTATPPLARVLEAAQLAVDLAKEKLAQVTRPPAKLLLQAARLEVRKSEVDVEALQRPPSPAALAAAQAAARLGKQKLAQVKAPPRPAVVEAARLDVQKARADLEVLRLRGAPGNAREVEVARLKVEAAETRLSVALAQTSRLTVRSPWPGTVTAILTMRGSSVDTATPLATVADLDHLAASVDLSEFDVAQVKRGMKARVGVDALGGKSFRGKVLFVALAGSDNGGLVTFPVRVSLLRAGALKPGMSVSVRIIVAERHGVVQVPLEAVSQNEDDEPIVTVVDEAGETKIRRVELGLANNERVEIVKGLRAGERVLLPESQPGQGEEQ